MLDTEDVVDLHRRHGPVGECIYCRARTPPLSSEHVVPFSLGGIVELTQASCRACATVTSQLELHMGRTVWGSARIRAGFPTRRLQDRPQSSTLYAISPEGERAVDVPASDFPAVAPMLWLPPPGNLIGRLPGDRLEFKVRFFSAAGISPDDVQAEKLRIEGSLDALKYVKFLAKVAHGFAVLYLGVDGFSHALAGLILGEPDIRPFDFVGGSEEILPPGEPPHDSRHTVSISVEESIAGVRWVCINLRLFDGWSYANADDGIYGAPLYRIVVGTPNELTEARLAAPVYYQEA